MHATGIHPGGGPLGSNQGADIRVTSAETAGVGAASSVTTPSIANGATRASAREPLGPAAKQLEHAAASEAHLAWVVEESLRHGRWLNTLALLEHIGCRKIVKSMDSRCADLTLLRHISEEARHALFFKELACRVSGGKVTDFRSEQLMCGDAARAYIQRLDHEISDVASKLLNADRQTQRLSYLCVTRAVEVRALDLYRRYEARLRLIDAPFSLRSILLEEGHHLEEMDETLSREGFNWEAHGDAIETIEARAFAEFLSALGEARRALSPTD